MCKECNYKFWLLRIETTMETASKTQMEFLNSVYKQTKSQRHITQKQKDVINSMRKGI